METQHDCNRTSEVETLAEALFVRAWLNRLHIWTTGTREETTPAWMLERCFEAAELFVAEKERRRSRVEP